MYSKHGKWMQTGLLSMFRFILHSKSKHPGVSVSCNLCRRSSMMLFFAFRWRASLNALDNLYISKQTWRTWDVIQIPGMLGFCSKIKNMWSCPASKSWGYNMAHQQLSQSVAFISHPNSGACQPCIPELVEVKIGRNQQNQHPWMVAKAFNENMVENKHFNWDLCLNHQYLGWITPNHIPTLA